MFISVCIWGHDLEWIIVDFGKKILQASSLEGKLVKSKGFVLFYLDHCLELVKYFTNKC